MSIPRGKYDPNIPELDLGDERMAPLAYEYYKHGFDWEDHARQEDSTAETVARELKAAKPGHAQEAARQVSRLPMEQLQYVALPFPHGLAERVRTILQRAFDYGYGEVWEEWSRQTGRKDSPQRAQRATELLDDQDDERKKEEIIGAAGAIGPEGGGQKAAGEDTGATAAGEETSQIEDSKSQGPEGPQEDTSQQPPKAAERGCLLANFRTGMYVIENGKKRWITEK